MAIVCIAFAGDDCIILNMPMFVIICKEVDLLGGTLLKNKFFMDTVHKFTGSLKRVKDTIFSIWHGLTYKTKGSCISFEEKGKMIINFRHENISKCLPKDGCNRIRCTISYNRGMYGFHLSGLDWRFVGIESTKKNDTYFTKVGTNGWISFKTSEMYPDHMRTCGIRGLFIFVKMIKNNELIICRNEVRHDDFMKRVEYILSL
jgi:hypothetical protein